MAEPIGNIRSSRISKYVTGGWRNKIIQFSTYKNALIIFCLLVLVYAYFYQEPGDNGSSRLGLTAAVVQDGTLTIDSFHEGTGLATWDKSEYNGHYYSDKAIGSSLLAAIPYAPIYWGTYLIGHPIPIWLMVHVLTVLVIGLPSALAGACVYLICERISGSPLRAGVVTAAVALGTMAFPFSIVFFGHQLAAALLWISFFLIFRLRFQANPPGSGYALLCGLLLGLVLITEYTTALIVLPLVAYYLYMLWLKRANFKIRTLLFPALGGLLPISIMFGYNFLVFGQPLVNSYQYLVDTGYREAMSHGLMGIGLPNLTVLFFETFQPAMGLFWQSPALLLIFPGAFYILKNRNYRVEGILALFIFVVYLVATSGYFQWWGGFSFGPRHIVPMLPFLCLPLIFIPRRLFPWLAGLTAVSVAQMMIVAASAVLVPDTQIKNFYNLGFFEYSSIYSYCLQKLLGGEFSWNLAKNVLGLSGWISLVPLIVVIAVAFWYLWRASPKQPELSGAVVEN